jgi:hypothetical protein
MNTQIHRKQIIILVLAMALAAVSYWIPLPQQSQPYPSPLILRESTHLSTPTETISYVREPATIWRFPVTIQIPQTPVQATLAPQTEDTQSVQALPPARLMNQRDFANGGDMPTVNPPLMPVKELNYDLKR